MFQLRKLHYIVKANANASLSQTFAKRLRIVGLFCTLHRARLAHYEAQRLVQDYGTHVITDVDVGIAAQQVSIQYTTLARVFIGNGQRSCAKA